MRLGIGKVVTTVVVIVTVTSGLPREDIDEVVDPPLEEPEWYTAKSMKSLR